MRGIMAAPAVGLDAIHVFMHTQAWQAVQPESIQAVPGKTERV